MPDDALCPTDIYAILNLGKNEYAILLIMLSIATGTYKTICKVTFSTVTTYKTIYV